MLVSQLLIEDDLLIWIEMTAVCVVSQYLVQYYHYISHSVSWMFLIVCWRLFGESVCVMCFYSDFICKLCWKILIWENLYSSWFFCAGDLSPKSGRIFIAIDSYVPVSISWSSLPFVCSCQYNCAYMCSRAYIFVSLVLLFIGINDKQIKTWCDWVIAR